mmetsp:Transcript_26847/g.52892  ORF Transcript_26847/g.52892 Transcript_26847/m.52892 type:complete len:132 (-) Transcript_26847:182-577(-)
MKSGMLVASLAQCFDRHADFFKMYTQFLNGFDGAIRTMDELSSSNKRFRSFLQSQTQGLKQKSGLMSYLILPVQRLPRYVLLLRELEKVGGWWYLYAPCLLSPLSSFPSVSLPVPVLFPSVLFPSVLPSMS